MKEQEETANKKWYKKRENHLIIIGFVIVVIGVCTPFVIMYLNKYEFNLVKFGELGTVGDFFGGTTVGLLSLASLIFVTAAMFMQKEELAIQRKEVTATRKEYEITNKTMRKQSFDSTFFNMINLHQNILENIKYENQTSRVAISLLVKNYKEKASYKYKYFKFKELPKGYNEKKYLLCEAYDAETKVIVHQELLKLAEDEDWELDDVDTKMDDLFYSTNDFSIELKDENQIESIDDDEIKEVMEERFRQLNIDSPKFEQSEEIIKEIIAITNRCKTKFPSDILNDSFELNSQEWEKYKKESFKELWESDEFILAHYIKNLYTIISYIDEAPKSIEKEAYYDILNSQLSINEKVLIYYYNKYIVSNKITSNIEILLFKDLENKNYFLWNDCLKNNE